MDRHQIETVVLEVLAAILKREVSLNSSRSNTPEWDSLKHMEIIFAVEDELGVDFSEAEIASIDGASTMVDLAMGMATHAA